MWAGLPKNSTNDSYARFIASSYLKTVAIIMYKNARKISFERFFNVASFHVAVYSKKKRDGMELMNWLKVLI
ncbi:hypothetical protein CIG19_11345 [Enterobacterales bacterium CwR94]|nr:hypothetical protein CIG19_11345 [Enterobacterales bacterium CwR94]